MANDAAHPEPGRDQQPGLDSADGFRGPPADWFVLLDRIEQEVRQLETHRWAWRELSRAGALNASGTSGTSGTSGPVWLGQLYFRSQAIGVRRMVDGDRRAGSFKRLLHKMTEDCVLLTRGWFVESAAAEDADAQFTRYADPWHSDHLDSEVPREDLRTLESSCAGIKRYVDQYVTHAQLDPDAGKPEPAAVDDAIDILLSLLAKYTLLLGPGRAGTPPPDAVV
ncbi:hypothetical protein [Arthrobacter pigmenti]